VTLLAVDAHGGQGGVSDESACQSGGFGGRTRATLSVTPGEVLHVEVAGAGSRYGGADPASWYRGGYNGGGDGHLDTVGGSRGGGGASDVRRAPYGLGNRLVVAGGGGGAGNLAAVSSGGAGGGTAAGMGAPAPNGGGGGTQNVGGAAGPTDTPVLAAATAGSAGQGGIGGYSGGVGAFTGGGGGGGWFGGGGAGGRASTPGAGGGGGSSFGPAGSLFDSGVWGNTGDCSAPDQGPRAGSVTIGPTPSAGTFHSLPPVRLLDTRTGVGAPAGLVSGDAVVELDVLGQGGVPVANVDAVVLNVTVTEPLGSGFLTA